MIRLETLEPKLIQYGYNNSVLVTGIYTYFLDKKRYIVIGSSYNFYHQDELEVLFTEYSNVKNGIINDDKIYRLNYFEFTSPVDKKLYPYMDQYDKFELEVIHNK